ncbi:MAG: hypothetical protein QXI58_02675 [Candidatus Micrarchaeia archaeon]|jgi:hypothetical protein
MKYITWEDIEKVSDDINKVKLTALLAIQTNRALWTSPAEFIVMANYLINGRQSKYLDLETFIKAYIVLDKLFPYRKYSEDVASLFGFIFFHEDLYFIPTYFSDKYIKYFLDAIKVATDDIELVNKVADDNALYYYAVSTNQLDLIKNKIKGDNILEFHFNFSYNLEKYINELLLKKPEEIMGINEHAETGE